MLILFFFQKSIVILKNRFLFKYRISNLDLHGSVVTTLTALYHRPPCPICAFIKLYWLALCTCLTLPLPGCPSPQTDGDVLIAHGILRIGICKIFQIRGWIVDLCRLKIVETNP